MPLDSDTRHKLHAAEMGRPLAIDLYCGLGGWTEGLLAAGFDVIGFDIEQHACGGERYPGQLVLQDVRTLHGSQFRKASLIVGSSPCQDFSYRAMPWKRAKAMHAPFLGMFLFWQQFRIQREACEAAGRHIPMVVENVRGAIPWVGRSAWNYGSYHLWGDVPALMPAAGNRPAFKGGDRNLARASGADGHLWDSSFADTLGRKNPGFRFDGSGRSFQSESVARHVEGTKSPAGAGGWFGDGNSFGHGRQHAHKSLARKAASAKIAKIPLTLSTWIGRCYLPAEARAA